MRLRIDLDKETTRALVTTALAERRPITLQAEVIIRRSLGLPFPHPGVKSPNFRQSEGVEKCKEQEAPASELGGLPGGHKRAPCDQT